MPKMWPGSQVSKWYKTKIKTYLPSESRETTFKLLVITWLILSQIIDIFSTSFRPWSRSNLWHQPIPRHESSLLYWLQISLTSTCLSWALSGIPWLTGKFVFCIHAIITVFLAGWLIDITWPNLLQFWYVLLCGG